LGQGIDLAFNRIETLVRRNEKQVKLHGLIQSLLIMHSLPNLNSAGFFF